VRELEHLIELFRPEPQSGTALARLGCDSSDQESLIVDPD
jgi:hypothetical protein